MQKEAKNSILKIEQATVVDQESDGKEEQDGSQSAQTERALAHLHETHPSDMDNGGVHGLGDKHRGISCEKSHFRRQVECGWRKVWCEQHICQQHQVEDGKVYYYDSSFDQYITFVSFHFFVIKLFSPLT